MNVQQFDVEFEGMTYAQQTFIDAEIARGSVHTAYCDMDYRKLIEDAKHFYPQEVASENN